MSFMCGRWKKENRSSSTHRHFSSVFKHPRTRLVSEGIYAHRVNRFFFFLGVSVSWIFSRTSTTRFPLHNGRIQVENYFFELFLCSRKIEDGRTQWLYFAKLENKTFCAIFKQCGWRIWLKFESVWGQSFVCHCSPQDTTLLTTLLGSIHIPWKVNKSLTSTRQGTAAKNLFCFVCSTVSY